MHFLNHPFIKTSQLGLLALVLGLTGCFSTEDESENESPTESSPKLTISVPASMTSSDSAARIALAANVADCTFDANAHSDWVENGYGMSKFLVALSQAESCVADTIIETMTANATLFANKGKVQVPNLDQDPTKPKYVEYQDDGTSSKLWLYFDEADVVDAKMFYIGWTKTGAGEFDGQMIFTNLPVTVDDPGAPTDARVDFTRSATLEKNDIYMSFAADHPGHVTGFHVEVSKITEGDVSTYQARGLLQTNGHFMPNLPDTETFLNPVLSIVTVADATGEGATTAQFNNLAFNIADGDVNTTGWNLGSYQFSDQNVVYFSATGAEQWKYKAVTEGHYVNTSMTNTRSGGGLTFIMGCLEVHALACGDAPTGVPDLNLGAGYFTDPCTDSDGADCTALVQAIYDLGFMGLSTNSALADVPTDWRADSMNGLSHLTTVWPAGADATTTFTLPTP